MQTFDCFVDALEEAKFCADSERRKYFVYFDNWTAKYTVRKKHSSKMPLFSVIEIGFGAKRYKEKDYI